MHGPTNSDPCGCHQTLLQLPAVSPQWLQLSLSHSLFLCDSKISAGLSSLLTRLGLPGLSEGHCEHQGHSGETIVPGPDILGIFSMGSSATASVRPQITGILILTSKVTLWMEGWREPLLRVKCHSRHCKQFPVEVKIASIMRST